ncbi:hypothetical protein [Burkholderia sp. SRS-W-2-2016]|uniref:hypothetical protein n=1 Tax=Burkholderia sp. SRS-W-2-2016 TaxID=1926878 RepID=UPI000AAEF7D1|nr:hypothetical protein [Burkholderia sp. SRS-W-2-2016]
MTEVLLFYAHDENNLFRINFIFPALCIQPLAPVSRRAPKIACVRNGSLCADKVFVPLRSFDAIEVVLRNHNVPRFALL